MKAKITAEWDNLRKVAVHSPGVEMYFGFSIPLLRYMKDPSV